MRLLPVILTAALGPRGRAALDLALLPFAVLVNLAYDLADAVGREMDRRARARAAGDESAVCDFDPLDPCEHAEIAAMRETIRLACADAERHRNALPRDFVSEDRAEDVIAWARDRIREIEDAYRTEPAPEPLPCWKCGGPSDEKIAERRRGLAERHPELVATLRPVCARCAWGNIQAALADVEPSDRDLEADALPMIAAPNAKVENERAAPEPHTPLPVAPGVLASEWVHYSRDDEESLVPHLCGAPFRAPTSWSQDAAEVTCPDCLKALSEADRMAALGEDFPGTTGAVVRRMVASEPAVGDRYTHAAHPGAVWEATGTAPSGKWRMIAGKALLYATAAELAAPPWQRVTDDAPPTPETPADGIALARAAASAIADRAFALVSSDVEGIAKALANVEACERIIGALCDWTDVADDGEVGGSGSRAGNDEAEIDSEDED